MIFYAKKGLFMKKKITNQSEIYSFDKKLDYETIKQEIDNKLSQLFSDLENDYNEHKVKALSNCTIALIQLTNGSRISEAIKTTAFFVKNPSRNSTHIKISKRKDKVTRVMKLPININPKILSLISVVFKQYDIEDEKDLAKLSSKVRTYLYDNFNKINTHSLRYALINYLSIKKQVPLNLVSKIVGHKNLNQLITYTQNHHVDDMLDKLSRNDF